MRTAIGVLAAVLATSGCATDGLFERSGTSDVETRLREAGFQLIPADTPQRIESMRSMPALAMSRVVRDGTPYYVYADPVTCRCLWVGNTKQHARYAHLTAEAHGDVPLPGEVPPHEVDMEFNTWDPDWGAVGDPLEDSDL